MGFFGKIFTWWSGATIGTALYSWRRGNRVGEDASGNRYFEARKGGNGLAGNGAPRRWVIYAGANDASRIPPEWHAWLHHQIDAVPDQALPPAPIWIDAPTPNLTGTNAAYRPAGALDATGSRARATGDYQAWAP
jgi:NADH:ubiquinone oxidoreductase subunit